MVTKVHGGVPSEYQNLTGHLTYLLITGTGIGNNAVLAGTTTPTVYGTTVVNNKITDVIVPDSAAEQAIESISQRSTVVIARSPTGGGALHIAVENAGDAWTFDPEAAGDFTDLIADILAATAIAVTIDEGEFTVV